MIKTLIALTLAGIGVIAAMDNAHAYGNGYNSCGYKPYNLPNAVCVCDGRSCGWVVISR
jgi:hypothetical protein